MKYDLRVRDSCGNLVEVLQELPDKGDKFPTILMVPGFGMDLHEYGYFDEVSDVLVKNGFQTFRFSFAGTGKSERDFISMTVDKQVQQLTDLLKYVKNDRFTNKRKIGILAQSFGTVIVRRALPIPGIKTIVFTATPPDPYTSLEKWFKRQRGFFPDGISQIQRADKRITKIGPQFWQNLGTYNFVREIQKLTQPLLLIHGGNDDRIRKWKVEEYFNHIPGVKRLQIIEKSDHAFNGKFRPQVLKLIADWFDETLR